MFAAFVAKMRDHAPAEPVFPFDPEALSFDDMSPHDADPRRGERPEAQVRRRRGPDRPDVVTVSLAV